MTAITLVEGALKRSDLPYFHELPQDHQSHLWAEAQDHFDEELAYFNGFYTYTDMASVRNSVDKGILVPVTEKPGQFGVARPIRDRYNLSGNFQDHEASFPYLQHDAAVVLDFLTDDFRCKANRDDEFSELLAQEGFSAARLSVYSLLRLPRYQRYIASQGRFALGRDQDYPERISTHAKARAADIDHAAFYATRSDTGEEIALNRDSDDKSFAALGKLLPRFRTLLREVITTYHNDGTVMAIEEVPQGWGGYHIAFKAA